jgi:hypothetical protein
MDISLLRDFLDATSDILIYVMSYLMTYFI